MLTSDNPRAAALFPRAVRQTPYSAQVASPELTTHPSHAIRFCFAIGEEKANPVAGIRNGPKLLKTLDRGQF